MQFVTVVVIMCVEVVLAFEEMHNYTATLGFTLSRANTFFDCLQDDELPDERSNPFFFGIDLSTTSSMI